jgi:DNA-binding transcriptional regulator YhcF (GntR family)
LIAISQSGILSSIGMVGDIQFDQSSSAPLYRQLADKIAQRIRGGILLDGERLPPTRELAGQLGLNRTTVSAAYEVLESEGLIRGHVGRGSFVRFKANLPTGEPGVISFESSRPAEGEFPMAFRALGSRDSAARFAPGFPAAPAVPDR